MDKTNGEELTGRERGWIRQAREEFEAVAHVEGESEPTPAPTDPFLEQEIPGYEVQRRLHFGGQGVVYRAEQRSTGRRVAIKFVKEGPYAAADERARFEREVRILGQIQHPGIVTIHDSGKSPAGHYFVMDFIQGDHLDVWAANPNRRREEIVEALAAISEAVNAAHLRGIIHRDLKPSNVRVDRENRPFVLDFGLAKVSSLTENATVRTTTGQFLGSLPWASPEQVRGDQLATDTRTDVYSLGVMLYQVLSGRFPYEVSGPFVDVVERITNEAPAPLRRAIKLDDELETITFKCLAKEPERRYQTAGELGRELRRYLNREPIEAKRDSAWYIARKLMSRYRVPTAIGSSFLLAGIVFGAAMTGMYNTARAQAVQARAHASEAERLLGRYRGLVDALEPHQVNLQADDLSMVMAKSKKAGEVLQEFSTDALKLLMDFDRIGPDYARFRSAVSPRLTGHVVRVGEAEEFGTLREAEAEIQQGSLVVLCPGEHSFSRDYLRKGGPPSDVAFVGAGVESTTLKLGAERAERLRLESLRIDCDNDPFAYLRKGGSLHVRSCSIENYNSGAGGSNALSGSGCIILIEDSVFDGSEGRAKGGSTGNGDAFDLRGSNLVFVRNTDFNHNDEILRVSSFCVLDRCRSTEPKWGVSLYSGGALFIRDCENLEMVVGYDRGNLYPFTVATDDHDFLFDSEFNFQYFEETHHELRRSAAFIAGLLDHEDARVREWAHGMARDLVRSAPPAGDLRALADAHPELSYDDLEASWFRARL